MNGLETQIVQAATGLLVLAVTTAISVFTPKTKQWIGAHTNVKTAEVASCIIDGLARITETVVQDFNQRVVNDAKAAGTWTPQLATSVKQDAVVAVMDQGSSLVALGRGVVGNVEALVASQVEQAVSRSKLFGSSTTQNTAVAQQTSAAPAAPVTTQPGVTA